MKKRLIAFLAAAALLVPLFPAPAGAAGRYEPYGFAEEKTKKTDEGTYHLLRHEKSGAQVVWLENDAEERSFAAGFRTPPEDSKGANHVLEHALLCGSEKYPVRELMHILVNSSVAKELNAYTSDDYTCYVVRTQNEADFYNLSDVYMDAVLNPLVRTEPNIFKQQGIRTEYADGKAQYNGIVFSELKLRSLDTDENSIEFVSEQMYRNLYGNGAPTLSAGGAIPDILDLTYKDVMRVYETYYKPSNMLIYLSGKQDISKTLKMLHGYLSKKEKTAVPEISMDNAPRIPAKRVQEYRMTSATKTVDIGWMAHGPDVLDLKKAEAWGALVAYLQGGLRDKFPDALAYTVGGTSGGVYNVGVMLSGVPAAQKDEAVKAFDALLADAVKNGIPAEKRDELLEDQKNAQQFGREEIFNGFAYGGDPFACIGRAQTIDALKNENAYFQTLAAEWRDTSYQTVVIVGNGAEKPSVPTPKLTASELEQVKRETEDFNQWVKTPDSAQAIATLPQLGAEDFSEDPFSLAQTSETTDEAVWYRTEDEKAQEASFSLYFPIEAKWDDLPKWCLLVEYLSDQMEKNGFSGYLALDAGARYDDPETLSPTLRACGSAEAGKAGEQAAKLAALLKEPPAIDASALRAFLAERKNALKALYSNPFYTEYGMMLRSNSQANRFLFGAPAGFVGSSTVYRDFIDRALQQQDQAALCKELSDLWDNAVRRGGILADFSGSKADYRAFQNAVKPVLAALPAGNGTSSCEFLPGGWPSALVVSSGTQDSNHVMLTGSFDMPENTAALRVLGSVLSAKYALPELRDKRGAYGTNVSFSETDVTFSCAGGVPVDQVIEVYQGAADWLRGLSLTGRELNGYAIRALGEFDEEAGWSRGSAAGVERAGRTQADFTRERQAILAVTLDDLKACAPLLDEALKQGRVFANISKSNEAGIRFPFACRVDADTGRITPRLKADIAASDDQTPLTRGGMAELLAASLIDQSEPERPELARFSDVLPGGGQADALAKLFDRGLLRGYADGTFHPDAPITRAEFCVIADALAVSGAGEGAPAFSDVPAGYWAYGVVSRMAAQGILKGEGDGTFRPENAITRADAVRILRRLAGQDA
ncbi:S-layer homology domain-containing protein [Agathobaculum sp.]|uniref:S-layer homology domain-containing protein n=1 Tax=Agathobaculum sp. TaxID=2048138 RepID=UPI002A82DAC5|nr:S-layer homology domain-containing protein [Agathobaculum sp.]MDY3619399.1 S-layer homology domain-containing protein [Agathobaculum sp.]